MTKEEIIKHLHKALNSVDITFPYRYVLVEAVEALSQSSLPFSLDEAAEEYSLDVKAKPYENLVKEAFKDGTGWQKTQMMKEAVDGYVNYYEDSGGKLMAEAQVGCPYHIGDKVRIIIVKEDK